MSGILVEQPTKSKNGKIRKFALLFTDSNPASGISAQAVCTSEAGIFFDARVKFGDTAPDSLIVTITDSDGITLAVRSLSASGSLNLTKANQPIIDGFIVTLSGNTEALATAEIFVYLITI